MATSYNHTLRPSSYLIARVNSLFLMKSILYILIVLTVCFPFPSADFAWALPPEEDIPEEILRTEIIIAARSPLDGKPISAADYAKLEVELQTIPPESMPKVAREVRQIINLLRLRKFIKTFFPFIPIR